MSFASLVEPVPHESACALRSMRRAGLPNPHKSHVHMFQHTLVALGVSIQVLSTLNEVVESRMVYVHQAMLCQRPSRLSTPSTAVGVAL